MLTNADIKLTRAERRRRERDERHDALINDAIKRQEKLGRDGDASNVVTIGAKTPQIVDPARFKDVEGFTLDERPHLSPTYHADTRGIVKAKDYTIAEYKSVIDGRYCPRCDTGQGSIVPQYITEVSTDFRCNPPGEAPGCTWPQGILGLIHLCDQLNIQIRVLADDHKEVA